MLNSMNSPKNEQVQADQAAPPEGTPPQEPEQIDEQANALEQLQ